MFETFWNHQSEHVLTIEGADLMLKKSQEKSTVGSVDWDHPSHRVEHGFRWNDIIQDIVIIRFIVIYLFTRQNTDSSYHSFKFRIHDAIDVLSIVIM